MIVVADTGPLNYLVLIGAVEVLQPLYTQVIVPKTVAAELLRTGAPAASRRGFRSRPIGSKCGQTRPLTLLSGSLIQGKGPHYRWLNCCGSTKFSSMSGTAARRPNGAT